MTEQKYKCGDEVLVRMRIVGNSYSGNFSGNSSLSGVANYFNESDIYSVAPEFTPGELVQVSNDKVNWEREKFAGYVEGRSSPFFTTETNWTFARKIRQSPEQKMLTDGVTIDGKKYKLVEE